MAKLGDICFQITDGSHNPPAGIENSKHLMLSSKNINDDEITTTAPRFLTDEQFDIENKRTNVLSGDLLMTIVGTVGRVAVVPEILAGICLQRSVAVIKPNPTIINNRYLMYQIQSMRKFLESEARGVAQKGIYLKQVSDLSVITPPLDEQYRVVDTLDHISSLIHIYQQQLSKLDELIKARFVEMFENNTYPKVKVSTVCDFITKGTTPPNDLISEEYSSDKIPYLKVYNLSFNGELLFDTAPQYISENIHNGMLARSKVYPHDVLMNIVGPPLGKFSLVTDEFPEWNINQAIAIFRAKEKINPKYLLSALMQPEVLNPFLRQAVGIRQLNISLSQCRDLEIFLPPLSLQNQFAAFVEEVDKQKQNIQQSLDKLELLKKALMQEYFG